jgi:hypothetical protein
MSATASLPIESWDHACTAAEQDAAIASLESGKLLLLPRLRFRIEENEQRAMSPEIAASSKNISLDPRTGTVRGSSAAESDLAMLTAMMARFARASTTFLGNLFPGYRASLIQGRTSFRPVEIAGRETSWRKDDTRLHVDSFPSTPVRDKRILRFFSNVSPVGQPRTWRVGEPFEAVATRYLATLRDPFPGTGPLLEALHITKGRRSDYDHLMLQLHDRMKADAAYQTNAPQQVLELEAGSSWIVFTDQVSHAALRGQYAFEQTCYLPVAAMRAPAQSPLRVLERLRGRALA